MNPIIWLIWWRWIWKNGQTFHDNANLESSFIHSFSGRLIFFDFHHVNSCELLWNASAKLRISRTLALKILWGKSVSNSMVRYWICIWVEGLFESQQSGGRFGGKVTESGNIRISRTTKRKGIFVLSYSETGREIHSQEQQINKQKCRRPQNTLRLRATQNDESALIEIE